MSRPVRILRRAMALALLACAQALPAKAAKILEPGVPVERLVPGQIHRYEMLLHPGQYCHLEVQQNHLDATVRVLSAEGALLAEVDNAVDREEPLSLSLSLVATREGSYRVEIRLRGRRTASGRYRLVMEPPRAATAADQKRLLAERLRGRGRSDPGSRRGRFVEGCPWSVTRRCSSHGVRSATAARRPPPSAG